MIKPVYIAIPLFALFITLDAWREWRERADEFDIKDTLTNVFVGLMSLVWGAMFGFLNAQIFQLCYDFAPFKLSANFWWCWVLLFFVDDFAYYWFHRISHESRFFWNFHVVHHSSNKYNLSVAVRQSWFGGAVLWIFYAPVMLMGFEPWMFAVVHGLNLLYQFWIHTRFVKRLGFLEGILNTPSHHRVHHGANDVYLDKNYGGVLIIWDRIFGTFVSESEEPRYGTITPLKSYNAMWINSHAWAEMFAAMRRKKRISDKIRCIFGSPNMNS
ncbi:MAG: sterol desaturase family protein [Pyrinomonadaceae bacterium]|nr:sterol desaturase family protein [Pyrinomonadaceae bacterium]